MTHPSSWKRRERQAAALFGARRQPLSGSAGRPGRSSSDSDHPTLYVETKLRASCAARALWEDVAAKARAEGKTPVVALASKGKPGILVVVHQDHLPEFIATWKAAHPEGAPAPDAGDGGGAP